MSEAPTRKALAGLVERVTFHSEESGFCVLRTKVRGHRDLVTVVGHAAAISAGEYITATGEWVNDRAHGQQFRARFLRASAPTSAEGIEKYIGSGMVRGVGPVYAKKLVRAFGQGGVRRHRSRPRPPARGGGHRPGARDADRRRLGGAEGDEGRPYRSLSAVARRPTGQSSGKSC